MTLAILVVLVDLELSVVPLLEVLVLAVFLGAGVADVLVSSPDASDAELVLEAVLLLAAVVEEEELGGDDIYEAGSHNRHHMGDQGS